MTICPYCEATIRDINMFCIHCGEELLGTDSFQPRGKVVRPQSVSAAPAGSREIKAIPYVSVSSNVSPAKPVSNAISISSENDPVEDVDQPEITPEPSEGKVIAPFPSGSDYKAPVENIGVEPERVAAPFPDLDDEKEEMIVGISEESAFPLSDGIPPSVSDNIGEPGNAETLFQEQAIGLQGNDQILSPQIPIQTSEQSRKVDPQPQMGPTTVPAPPLLDGVNCRVCGFYNNRGEAKYCGQCGSLLRQSYESGSRAPYTLEIIEPDGELTESYDITEDGVAINGCNGEPINRASYQADVHAIFRMNVGQLDLIPPLSGGAIFARIPPKQTTSINGGEIFKIGSQYLKFELGSSNTNAWGILRTVPPSVQPGVFMLDVEDVVIGRESGAIKFPDDPLISRAHTKFFTSNGKFFIYDLSSTNGTFYKIEQRYQPMPGQMFIIEQKIFRISLEQEG